MRRLDGRRVLITGAARGIGLATARRFAARRAELILTDVADEALSAAAAELRAGGARVSTFVLDVTDAEAIRRVADEVHVQGGPIQILVNNAGTVFGGAFLEVPLARHRTTYEVNTLGLVAMTHAFLPDLLAADEGHVVNIASAAGFIGLPWGATYASSKWAVVGFSESIRLELEAQGQAHVGVTAICPSVVGTGLFAGARPPRTTTELRPETVAAAIIKAVERNQPLVLLPAIVHLTPLLRGILPTRWFDRVGKWFGVLETMRAWRGHGGERPAEQPAAEAAATTDAGRTPSSVS